MKEGIRTLIEGIARKTFRRRAKLVLQNEFSECGLACIAMVAQFHGAECDLAALRSRSAISSKGTTLKDILVIAQDIGLSCRPLKAAPDYLSQARLPAIMHWDQSHFVVLEKVSRSGVFILDPAVGYRHQSWDELGKHYTGVLLEVTKTSELKSLHAKTDLGLLGTLNRLASNKRALLSIIAISMALEVSAILLPLQLQWTIDFAVPSRDYELLNLIALGFLAVACIQTFLVWQRGWVVSAVSNLFNFDWLTEVFDHMLKLPLDYFERRHVGDVVSRMRSVTEIQKAFTIDFIQSLVDGVLVVGTFGMMLYYSVNLSLASLALLSCYAAVRYICLSHHKIYAAENILHGAKQSTHFLETIRGIQAVKLNVKSLDRRLSWQNELAKELSSQVSVMRVESFCKASETLLVNLDRILLVWLASRLVMSEAFTFGMFFAFFSFREQFFRRSVSLVDGLARFALLSVHAQRVADVLSTPPESNVSGTAPRVSGKPTLEVRDLAFRYSKFEPEVFSNVGFKLSQGQSLALVGPSGCGKSTLLKVVAGLLTPQRGEVWYSGSTITGIGLDAYRSSIGAVTQDDVLFMGSIIENISFFDLRPDEGFVQECAKMAAIHNEIMEMPMGYHTLVSNFSGGLSGGQRQRLLLARAFYRRPRILLLDEATSNLDETNERVITRAIDTLNVIKIIAAHRLNTIETADQTFNLGAVNKA